MRSELIEPKEKITCKKYDSDMVINDRYKEKKSENLAEEEIYYSCTNCNNGKKIERIIQI